MDYNRLSKVIKWNVIADKQQIIRNTIGFVIAFCVIVLSQSMGNWLEHSCPDMGSSASIISFIVILYIMVKASQVCFNMKTKTALLSYAMLPATKSEKFVANVFHQTIIVIAQVAAAVVVTDVMQAIISLCCCGNASSIIYSLLSHDITEGVSFNGVISSIDVCLLTHATFVLGGTFFRKHQFLYTAITIFVVTTVLSTVIGLGIAGVLDLVYEEGYNVSIEWLLGSTATEVLLNIIVILIALAFYLLAYRYFCRIQVINNKFYN